MPSTRTAVSIVAALGITAVLLGLGYLAATRDEAAPVTGDRVAYSCKEPKNPWYAVCIVRSDGTGVEQITRHLPTTDAAWSPDGRRIAFTRNEDTGEALKYTHDDVFVMDADGSDVRQVTPDKEGRSLSQPAWSPDGRQLVYVDGGSTSSAVASRYGNLFVIGDDGSGDRRLTSSPDADPDWSPDGREVALVRGENLPTLEANDDIWVLDVRTGTARQLTHTPPGTYEAAPAWSPDGAQIVFSRRRRTSEFDGATSLHLINRDGTAERRILDYTLFGYSPYSLAWSPDGKTIAFEASTSIGCVSISLLDVVSGSIRPLTSCSRPREATAAPDWQPAPDSGD